MVVLIKVTGLKTIWMDTVFIHGLMVVGMKVLIQKTRNMGLASILGLMDVDTKESGKMAGNMV